MTGMHEVRQCVIHRACYQLLTKTKGNIIAFGILYCVSGEFLNLPAAQRAVTDLIVGKYTGAAQQFVLRRTSRYRDSH